MVCLSLRIGIVPVVPGIQQEVIEYPHFNMVPYVWLNPLL